MTRGRRRGRRSMGAGSIAVVIALALTACLPSTGPIPASTGTGEQVPAALEPYYGQTLEWEWCGAMQCATATAPLHWDDPVEADDIELALVRQPATGGDRLGTLFVNPGGPGASGVDFITGSIDYAVGDALQRRYDIVGFDPRGVGASTAVDCGPASVLDEYLYSIPEAAFGTDAWIAETGAAAAAFGAACLESSGGLLGAVDTASAARDLDMLRSVLGDDRLNYLGYSYGTLLGAVYADRFPQRTGRLVLDGAIDPVASDVDMSVAQAQGFERAFDAYAAWCLDQSQCPFTGSVRDARQTVADLLAAVAASPLRAADGRDVGSATMFTAIIVPLYNQAAWPQLTQLFTTSLRGDPSAALALADQYNERDDAGQYRSNIIEAFTSIFCLDERSDASLPAVRAEEARIIEAAPLFGQWMAYGAVTCAQWPVPATRDREPIAAEGSADILVIGTTRDPATPYEWAVTLAGTLERGHLITYDGDGHTGYNKGSECVDAVVEAFFIDGVVPDADPQC